MPFNWAILTLIIGALIGLGAIVFGKTKQKRTVIGVIGAFILIAGILFTVAPNTFPYMQSPLTVTPTPTTTTPTTTVTTTTTTIPSACAVEDTTVKLESHNKYEAGTALTDASTLAHRVFIWDVNKNDWSDYGYVSDGDTFTASPGDKLRILFGENSTAEYSKEVITTVPCSGTLLLDEGLAPYDSSPTVTIWLEDGSVMSSSNLQDMTDDATYTLPIRIRASSKASAGSPYHPGKGNIFCVQGNNTVFDKFELAGQEASKVPRALSASAGKEEWCYYVPPQENNNYIDLSMVVDTGGTNPGANATYYLYDVDIDLNADTLATINDVEDEDFNDLGYTSNAYIATGTIYVK